MLFRSHLRTTTSHLLKTPPPTNATRTQAHLARTTRTHACMCTHHHHHTPPPPHHHHQTPPPNTITFHHLPPQQPPHTTTHLPPTTATTTTAHHHTSTHTTHTHATHAPIHVHTRQLPRTTTNPIHHHYYTTTTHHHDHLHHHTCTHATHARHACTPCGIGWGECREGRPPVHRVVGSAGHRQPPKICEEKAEAFSATLGEYEVCTQHTCYTHADAATA